MTNWGQRSKHCCNDGLKDFKFQAVGSSGWEWVKTKNGIYLKSELLSNAGFRHGFFTKLWNGYKPIHLNKFLQDEANVFSLKQIHSNKVIEVPPLKSFPPVEADGLVSKTKNQSLWVCTADCIPGLIADPQTGNVCAFHAGWRGIASNIIHETLMKMTGIKTNVGSLLIALGPAISGKNYPVGEDVAEAVFKHISKTKPSREQSSRKDLFTLKPGKDNLPKCESSNKILLDLRLAALDQLLKESLDVHQISIAPFCTFKENDLFHSWRRDRVKAVQWSGIVSREGRQ